MTPNSHTDPDTRSVETAWAEQLTEELPLDATDDPRAYADFLFGNPVFTMTDVDPDSAVVLIDRLLDRYTPMAFFDVEGALTTSGWADLKETLVTRLAEGVDGERPGPASSFPTVSESAPKTSTIGGSDPARTQSPDAPESPGTTAPVGQGLASEGPDLSDVDTPTSLARAVRELVEAADVEPGQARQALELVLEELEREHDEE
jgi:hypothetical protein